MDHIFHALPIISRSRTLRDVHGFIRSASAGLLAGIYALALPFTAWDETLCVAQVYSKPSSRELWRICYRCLQREMHFPQLSTIQMSLLLLNQPSLDVASYDTPAAWSLASSTLAQAQALGIHMDPAKWKLPPWEIRLRRRLWWSVVVEHVWRALTQGRQSLLMPNSWNVSPLTTRDFRIDPELRDDKSRDSKSYEYFLQLCTVTLIADDVCRSF